MSENTTNDLLQKKCVPCEGGALPMSLEEVEQYMIKVPGWNLSSDTDPEEGLKNPRIYKEYKFKDFKAAMEFVNKVADIANTEDHHPDIHVSYNKVNLELWTHAIGGLSENDFIVAAKVDSIK